MENKLYFENDAYLVIPESNYDIAILVGERCRNSLNSTDDNVDIEVRFKDGKLYTGSFLTVKNIESLFAKNKKTGELQSGLYFYCKDMIVVESITTDVVISTIKHLFEEELLEEVFGSHTSSEN